MKTLIIYTSQTGFTKRYAEWLAERMSGDLLELKDARKKAYEATEWVSFENKYMRHDIGKAIDEA